LKAGLTRLALIVRAADVKGQESVTAEGSGLRTIAEGFAAMQLSDEERKVGLWTTADSLTYFDDLRVKAK
jgi:hypothetical protein